MTTNRSQTETHAEITRFFDRHTQSYPTQTTPHDPDWASPCEVGQPYIPFGKAQSDAVVAWQPVPRHPLADDFSGLENALEMPIHPDIKAHYGSFWSGNLYAKANDGDLCLLYVWNQKDVDRLIENLIGHAVACRQNKIPYAVFFACTEPDADYFLTINNTTGEIQLEAPGQKPIRTVAGSLGEFMASLTPIATPDPT